MARPLPLPCQRRLAPASLDASSRPPAVPPAPPQPARPEAIAADAAFRLQGAVLATVAQELSTPLMMVWGYADVLRRYATDLDAPQAGSIRESLAHVQTALRQVAALTGALQDVGRVRLGRPPQPRTTDLAALARARVAAWQTTTAQHRLRVRRTAGPLRGWWDPLHLRQILDALLSNAVAYSPEGGAVTVSLARVAGAGGAWARLAVADAGIGIAPEDLPVLGERVHRGASVAQWIPGAGLGLVLVRHLLTQLDGQMVVASERGVGTTVTVLLPLPGLGEGAEDGSRD